MSDRTPDPGAAERPTPPVSRDSGSAAERLWWFRDAREPLPPPPAPWLRWPRREHTLDAIACLSLSTLCFSQTRSEMLFRPSWDFYNQIPLGAPAIAAFMLNVVGLTAVGAAAVILLLSLNFARITHETVSRWTDFIGRPGVLALVVLVLAASLSRPQPALRLVRGLA